MSSSTIKFLERKDVIQFFGFCLFTSPFVNVGLVLYTKMQDYKLTWAQINLLSTLKNGLLDNYVLSLMSLVIGVVMLRGSAKAWRAVLILIGSHIVAQVLNYKTVPKGDVLWWTFLLVNASVFIFVADQLVWKIQIPERTFKPPASPHAESQILHLKTFKKIYLRHDDPKPWAEIKNMNSKGFQAHCLKNPTDSLISNVASRKIRLKLSQNFELQARLKKHTGSVFSFEFVEQTENHDEQLNSWFKKIAV